MRASMSGSACKPVGPGGRLVEVFELREEVIVRDEEALDGTVEYDDIDPIVGLDRRDDLIQLRMLSGPKMLRGGWSKMTRQ